MINKKNIFDFVGKERCFCLRRLLAGNESAPLKALKGKKKILLNEIPCETIPCSVYAIKCKKIYIPAPLY